jgi:aldose 1-epimerase
MTGEPLHITGGSLRAQFLADCGMLCTSLRHRGAELIALPRSIDEYRAGGCTGIPLLHPWANRLRSHGYSTAGHTIDLRSCDVPTDRNGLPIHGVMQARRFTTTTSADRIEARFAFDQPELLAVFPWPHDIIIVARITDDGPGTTSLTIDTTVHNHDAGPMPIAFGWHPFLQLPGSPRAQWRLRLPPRQRHVLDERMLPTGTRTEEPADDAAIGARTYDDHYDLGTDRNFVIADEQRSITVAFDEHYPHAQIYLPGRGAPVEGEFVCIEPMIANVDALAAGTAPLVAPGERFTASFSITVRDS